MAANDSKTNPGSEKPVIDPLDSQELSLLNQMLASIHQQARAGDPDMIDRVIKILQLKRALRRDREEKESL